MYLCPLPPQVNNANTKSDVCNLTELLCKREASQVPLAFCTVTQGRALWLCLGAEGIQASEGLNSEKHLQESSWMRFLGESKSCQRYGQTLARHESTPGTQTGPQHPFLSLQAEPDVIHRAQGKLNVRLEHKLVLTPRSVLRHVKHDASPTAIRELHCSYGKYLHKSNNPKCTP